MGLAVPLVSSVGEKELLHLEVPLRLLTPCIVTYPCYGEMMFGHQTSSALLAVMQERERVGRKTGSAPVVSLSSAYCLSSFKTL